MQKGIDPYTHTVHPLPHPINYPRFLIWIMQELGITDDNLMYFGTVFDALFILAISLLIYRAQSRTEALQLTAACVFPLRRFLLWNAATQIP